MKETPEEIVKMESAMRLARRISEINNIPEYDFDHQTQRREMITEAIQKAMQEFGNQRFNAALSEAIEKMTELIDSEMERYTTNEDEDASHVTFKLSEKIIEILEGLKKKP